MAAKSLTSSAAVMASGTLVSRLLGLVRAALLAAAIATTGGAADAFSVANKLPTIIYMLIAGGVLNAVLVPQIVRAMRNSDGGHRYVNQLLTLGATALAIITAILTAGAGILVSIYAATINPDWKPLAVTFAYICVPQLFFYGLYALLGQVLNAHGNFGPYMWAPALNNVVSIMGLAVYLYLFGEYQLGTAPAAWDSTRIWLVAGTATAGIAAQALVLLIPLYRSGFRIVPVFSFRNSGLGRASKVAGWAFAALLVGQIGYLVISNLAAAAGAAGENSGLILAGNAAYDHAFAIFMLPQSLITVSLVTAMFTRLSHHAAAGELNAVRDQLSIGLRTLGVFTVFATAAVMVLAIPLVSVVLAGSPQWEAQRAIGHVVVAFALGITPIGIWTMTQRVYYAYEDTRSLFRIQIPMMLIVVGSSIFAYFLFPPAWWVVVGAALGTTLSNSFGALVSYLALRRKLPDLDGARVLRTHLRVIIAVLPPALVGWGLLHLWGVQATLLGSFLRVALLGTLMGIGYLAMLRVLQVTELDGLLSKVLRMAAPVTRRGARIVNRLPGAATLRKIGSFFAPSDSKESAVATKWTVGETIADRYRLILRTSSFAEEAHSITTWEAFDSARQQEVRLLTLSGASERRVAALDGARRQTVLSDPRFPRVLQVLDARDEAIVVTEPVRGSTLAELIDQRALTAEEVRSIVGETALAMQVAHRHGMHHLALGPDLIVVHGSAIKILGLGTTAHMGGLSAKSSDHSARKDTIALAQILLAGLSGTWIGSRNVGLPHGGTSVASAEDLHDLAPDAPLDLIRLCHITISPFEEGPHTPAEFSENLLPWQPIPQIEATEIVTEDYVTGEFLAVSAPAPAQNESPTDVPTDSDDHGGPGPVQQGPEQWRHSKESPVNPAASIVPPPSGWDVSTDAPAPGVRRAPAPERAPASQGDSPFAPAHGYQFPPVAPRAAAPRTSTPPNAPSAASAVGRDRLRQVAEHFRPIGDGDERRFNPAGFVLLAMLALLIFAVVLATSSLRSAWNYEPETAPILTPEPTESEPENSGEEAPAPTDLPEDDPAPIVIKEAITFDPAYPGGENQDIAANAIDGNPDTEWRSLRYTNPRYGNKAGLAYSVVLQEEAQVSQVDILLRGKGGLVEIRAGDPTKPTEGPVLASGPMDGETTFTFDSPVTTDTIVLWFPELPRAGSDGLNRIELAEVTLK